MDLLIAFEHLFLEQNGPIRCEINNTLNQNSLYSTYTVSFDSLCPLSETIELFYLTPRCGIAHFMTVAAITEIDIWLPKYDVNQPYLTKINVRLHTSSHKVSGQIFTPASPPPVVKKQAKLLPKLRWLLTFVLPLNDAQRKDFSFLRWLFINNNLTQFRPQIPIEVEDQHFSVPSYADIQLLHEAILDVANCGFFVFKIHCDTTSRPRKHLIINWFDRGLPMSPLINNSLTRSIADTFHVIYAPLWVHEFGSYLHLSADLSATDLPYVIPGFSTVYDLARSHDSSSFSNVVISLDALVTTPTINIMTVSPICDLIHKELEFVRKAQLKSVFARCPTICCFLRPNEIKAAVALENQFPILVTKIWSISKRCHKRISKEEIASIVAKNILKSLNVDFDMDSSSDEAWSSNTSEEFNICEEYVKVSSCVSDSCSSESIYSGDLSTAKKPFQQLFEA